jgi:hypothetical protein
VVAWSQTYPLCILSIYLAGGEEGSVDGRLRVPGQQQQSPSLDSQPWVGDDKGEVAMDYLCNRRINLC